MSRHQTTMRARVMLKDIDCPSWTVQVYPKLPELWAPLLACENFMIDQQSHAQALGCALELEYADL